MQCAFHSGATFFSLLLSCDHCRHCCFESAVSHLWFCEVKLACSCASHLAKVRHWFQGIVKHFKCTCSAAALPVLSNCRARSTWTKVWLVPFLRTWNAGNRVTDFDRPVYVACPSLNKILAWYAWDMSRLTWYCRFFLNK